MNGACSKYGKDGGIYGFGQRPTVRGTPIARTATLLAAVLVLLAAPVAGHGLIDLSVEVPPSCPQAEACLQLGENQPRLHAGEAVDLNAYNDDQVTHELHVAPNTSADPGRAATEPERAIASTGPIEPNGSRAVPDVAIPPEAEALYVWCSVDDHEARGERLVVPLADPHADDGNDASLGLAPPTAALAMAAAVVAWRTRFG
jgi:hypothetical protein